MTEVTIMKIGSILIVPIQVELHNSAAAGVQQDIISNIEQTGARGLMIDVSKLQIVDSFLGRLIGDTAAMARIMGCHTAIVGLQPEVAITMMELGMYLEGIYTALDTETGLELLEKVIRDEASNIGTESSAGE